MRSNCSSKRFRLVSYVFNITALMLMTAMSIMGFDDRHMQATHDRQSKAKETKTATTTAPDLDSPETSPPVYQDGSSPRYIALASADNEDGQSSKGQSSGKSGSQRASRANDAPLTPGGKFKYFATRSFLSPGAYGKSIASGLFGEWIDDDNHHHAKPEDFAADSMTRAARSFAFGTTANFFEKFAYASLFKQDPRYHRSERKGFGTRAGYAISRVFVTRGDKGTSQFNASFFLGGLTAAGISNAWERDERVNIQGTMKRWGIHVGLAAVSNIFREFIGKK